MRTDESIPNRIGVIVGIVTLLVYSGALSCGFINLDDPFYITNNQLIKHLDLSSLLKIFTDAHLGAWLPLTYLSFAIDYQIWGENPFGYHLTNIVLHAVNGALVVLLADRFCGERSLTVDSPALGRRLRAAMLLIAGLLFSLHPLRVESVAWAAERKDVLNGLFTILAVLAYARYIRLTETGGGVFRRRGAYLLSLSLFALSLLAKQASVTLPVILLLLDWYPLGRLNKGNLRSVLVEKMPFFLVSAAIIFTTLYFAMMEKMLVSTAGIPILVRLAVSGNALFEYVRLTLLPVGISPYFLLPKPLPYGYPVKAVLVAALTILVAGFARRERGVAVCWFCFVIAMAPMLAFFQTGDDIAMAARYTYLPAIVPTIGVAALLSRLFGKWRGKGRSMPAVLGIGLMAVLLSGAIMVTVRLIPVWRDTGTFWSRVIDVAPVGRAYGDRGVFYLINGRSAEAANDFSAAIDMAVKSGLPSIYNLYAFRGVALSDAGRYEEAVRDFSAAIDLRPHPTYFHLRGTALQSLGRKAEADDDFRRAGPDPPPIDWFD